MGVNRKKEIYDICVRYDVIIVEDDPYYFLQEGSYTPKSRRTTRTAAFVDNDAFLANLIPSFLKFDYQGRVIRLDTFSKTIAPGSRLGWFTCSPLFAERLERQSEVSTQAPCGFSQSLVTKLLLTWKYDGYLRWLKDLGAEYTRRRDQLMDCLHEEFTLQFEEPNDGGPIRYLAYLKSKTDPITEKFSHPGTLVFSFVPPSSGMFIWIRMHFEEYPAVSSKKESLEIQLWTRLAEAGLLIAPGYIFDPIRAVNDRRGHYRLSFSEADASKLKQGMAIFARILGEFFTEG